VPFTNGTSRSGGNPKRQQVIIFKPPFAPDTPDYVKRVIGLPETPSTFMMAPCGSMAKN